MDQQELIPHLFRTEYSKIIAVLCSHFGINYIEVAEDIVSDTFLTAAELWGIKGIPENPAAWLYTVAKNKTRNYLKRHQLFEKKIVTDFKNQPMDTDPDIDLSTTAIADSQLAMIFTVCHPSVSEEAQIALALSLLCGFGVQEIADAFLTNKETVYKRLKRAKEKLREENIAIAPPSVRMVAERMETVLTTLYLLFNEGYYSVSGDHPLKKDCCMEAMRLCLLLLGNPLTDTPATNALMALMCFHASRFEARTNSKGEIILYEDQDTRLWNKDLVEKGIFYLNCAANGSQLSKFHLEAGIAYWHTHPEDNKEKWEAILQLYNKLLMLEYTPVAALNRTYALAKANSIEEAIAEAEKLQLTDNHFYFVLLGTLYEHLDPIKAKTLLQTAKEIARSESDRQLIQKKIAELGEKH
ncbi:RNA polymerase sigma factor [Niabella drilacis]|uniref:RNA polymerase sigma-70 factor, ECF subfamily n=1 Tax=Niabella drilacis (strain DSM 25811 / CCM 8410 / CCUG 62505 / LMG 26954 / E90) TaxID=1285928 RepID=A0A1G6U3N5_NIADE|nr:sigma-70 family RNA polymerase sigma factor [Niabella drilacis]SDD36022.1 RNA polymerase sigma-70 factor, ECF subfamily [Niabella drilacis]